MEDCLKPSEPIAIVGIGCRLPGGVHDPSSFWRLLLERTDAIADVPPERWNHSLFHHPDPGKPRKTAARQAGLIPLIDRFDAEFFGISPREASQIDPQHRLLLELAWEALEDGGIDLAQIAATDVGVFVGIASHEYALLQTLETVGTHTAIGGASCMAANRISYALNLLGPSLSVDTACSSSLVAVHLACSSLWRGESSLALAGGVNLLIDPTTFVSFSYLSMLSPDSRCFAFDARANGFVRAEGGGIVVLKPLGRARADHDRIYAVILATACNQDGHSKGLTFPSQASQEAMLRDVYRRAGVSADRVAFVEAHGTGTPAGDPVEALAIGKVLASGLPPGRALPLGSVKTNIGHLEAGAGIASLIKVALALDHGLLPANLHFREPNPRIPLAELRLSVPVGNEPLQGVRPRVAGVNSFGFGGTNAHVVLTEALQDRDTPPGPAARAPFLLPISARGREALVALAGRHASLLRSGPDAPPLTDVLYSASVRRTHHRLRLAVWGDSPAELAERIERHLKTGASPGLVTGEADSSNRLAFVFSGQGPQWWAMGRELLEREPVFRGVIDECDRLIRGLGDWSLLTELTAEESRSRMHETSIGQPAIFALQAGLAALWRDWGVVPDAVVGHSMGEIAAGHVAGLMDLPTAVRVAFHRGRCMDRASSRGGMLAVGLDADSVAPLLEGLEGRVCVAAINSPTALTLSGEPDALGRIAWALDSRGVFCKPLRVEYAFHSAQMDPIESEILRALSGLKPQAARLRLISAVTGLWSAGTEWDAGYWWRNLRQTVRFGPAVETLVRDGYRLFLEVGPHPVLSGPILETLRHCGVSGTVLSSLRRKEGEAETLRSTLGALYVRGLPVDWSRVQPHGRRVALPPYPWQRESYWSEADSRRRYRHLSPAHPLLGKHQAGSVPLWEGELDTRLIEYLADHRLDTRPVLPASAYLEMALAAGALLDAEGASVVEELELALPCFIPKDEPLTLQVAVSAGEPRLTVSSRRSGVDSWTRHASARLSPRGRTTASPGETPKAIRARLPQEVSGEVIYDMLAQVRLHYGDSFRGLARLWRRDGEALGEIRAPRQVQATMGEYHVHPGVLDSCFQVIIGAIPWKRDASPAQLQPYLPASLERCRLFKKPQELAYAHVRLREWSRLALTVDLRVIDEGGELLLELAGLRCVPPSLQAKAVDAMPSLLYRSTWQPQPRPEAAAVETEGRAETWLVFADQGGTAPELSKRLRLRGTTVLTVRPGESFALPDADTVLIRPDQLDDMRRLLAEAMAPHRPPVTKVVHLWSLDAAPSSATSLETLVGDEILSSLSLLNLVQAWDPADPLRLWIVTRRAQATSEEEAAQVSVAQAPVWGLRRVMAFEHPQLRPAIVDLSDADPAAEVDALLREIVADGDEDEVALRGDVRLVHRYQHASQEALPPLIREIPPARQPFRLECARPGLLDTLQLRLTEPPSVQIGHSVVEVKAAGLNFADVLKALGLYPSMTEGPLPLGGECAGILREVGPEPEAASQARARRARPGDRVLAIGPHCFGAFVTAPSLFVAPIPDSLGFEQAAGIPIVFLTALYALEHAGRLRSGERVLVHSASGGVGLAAIQVARRVGAEVLATAGSHEKRELLRSMGIRHVMDSRSLDFAEQTLTATGGEGVDVVLNSLAGEAIPKGLSILRPFGRFLEIGKRDIYGDSRIGLGPFRNNVSFIAIDLDQAIRGRPVLVAELLDEVVSAFETGCFTPLPSQVFPITQAQDAFRLMSKAQHVGKVVLSNAVERIPVAAGEGIVPVSSEAAYLITGGTGGFGLACAEWLAAQGARHLVLLSRSGVVSADGLPAIERMTARGCEVRLTAADVADRDQLRRVLTDVASSMPPLRGVVHAAMVLDDGVLRRLDRERFRVVTRPKVLGAWNLHQLTAHLPLDFFIMTSSIASVLGSPGQGSYAAANAFLDALAHYRKGLGLAALGLNLGPLASVGHVARHPELVARMESGGLALLEPREVFEQLTGLFSRRAAQVGIARVSWERQAGVDPLPPRLAELAAGASDGRRDGRKGGDRGLLDSLRAAPAAGAQRLLEAALAQELARVLGTTPDRVALHKPLSDLGLDSLMAVELQNWCEASLDVALPAMRLVQDPTLEELGGFLLERLLKVRGSDKPGAPAPRCEPSIDLELDPAIRPAGAARADPGDPRAILLTGATGFLGAHTLRELLAQTRATVYCLVRAHGTEEAMLRILSALESTGPIEPDLARRITPVVGDLAEPGLGLTAAAYDELAASIDTVFHLGAAVSFAEPYETLRRPNVLGTREILRFCCTGKTKWLHHVSTIGVFEPLSGAASITEDAVPDVTAVSGGYGRSKAVAEHLVRTARGRGLSARIYRPGLLGGDTQRGALDPKSLFRLLFAASTTAQVAPDLRGQVSVLPIDVAAKAIVHLSARPQTDGFVFHLCNPSPTPLRSLLQWLPSHGVALSVVPYDVWRRRLLERVADPALRGILAIIPEDEGEAERLLEQDPPRVSLSNTLKALGGSGIVLPPFDEAMLAKHLEHLQRLDLTYLRL